MYDLTNESGLTFALLDDMRAWRQRAVIELELSDSDHVSVESTYQMRIPLSLIRRFQQGVNLGDPVRLVLPFMVRPKGELLLDVNVVGPGRSSAFILLRQDAAKIQTAYLAHLSESTGDMKGRISNLLAGICAYTSDAWERTLEGRPQSRLGWQRKRRRVGQEKILAGYLQTDLGFNIQPSDILKCLEVLEEPRLKLVEALGEGEVQDSASECMLLAIPFMADPPRNLAELHQLAESFQEAVHNLSDDGLTVLAEYGRRWEMFIDTVVPAGQLCSVKLSERRPWPNAPSRVMSQEVAFGDAATSHVEIRAADHGVVIRKPKIYDLAEKKSGFEVVDATRVTADAVAFYASNDDRPYRAKISVEVWPRRFSRLLVNWLLVLIVLAGVAVARMTGGNDLVDALALMAFPLTLAGAVVLARETTPLAERLLRRSRYRLGLFISGLWVVILVRMLLSADLF